MADELEPLKQKVKTSDLLNAKEKQEWLFLLPKMSQVQLEELQELLSIHMPPPKTSSVFPPAKPKFFSTPTVVPPGRVQQVSQPPPRLTDLPPPRPPWADRDLQPPQPPPALHITPPSVSEATSLPQPVISIPIPAPPAEYANLNDAPESPLESVSLPPPTSFAAPTRSVEDLHSVTVAAMRQAPSIFVFLEELGKKMKETMARQNLNADEVMQSFEQSPLYKVYLEAGLKIMDGQEPATLTRSEFEAMTDFRAALRKNLSF